MTTEMTQGADDYRDDTRCGGHMTSEMTDGGHMTTEMTHRGTDDYIDDTRRDT